MATGATTAGVRHTWASEPLHSVGCSNRIMEPPGPDIVAPAAAADASPVTGSRSFVAEHPTLTGVPPPPSDRTSPEADQFYAESLRLLDATGIPFLVAGTFAVNCYTGINRPTKDIDIFCKPGDFPRILLRFKELGFTTEIEDERWLAKVRRGDCFFDVIFGSAAGIAVVNEHWFEESHPAELLRVTRAADAPDRAHLVEGLHSGPPPL